jgi:hypothetical protein
VVECRCWCSQECVGRCLSVDVGVDVPFVHESRIDLAVLSTCEAKELLEYLPYGRMMEGVLKTSLDGRRGSVDLYTGLESAFERGVVMW